MLKNRRYSLMGSCQNKVMPDDDIRKNSKTDNTLISCKAIKPTNISKENLNQASAVESRRYIYKYTFILRII